MARQSIFLAKNNQTFGDGEFGQTRDAVDIQLAHDVLAVGFHGANTDSEGAGDFLIAEALGDVNQNFPLAIGGLRGVDASPGRRTNWFNATRATSGLKKASPEWTVSMARTNSSREASLST